MRSPLLAFVLALCSFACAPAPEEEMESTDSALVGRPAGGETGAFLREVTPAGYGCIGTTFVLPDYTATDAALGTPWVYFGFSDTRALDAEIGFSFQHGDGTASRPRRWLPYIRRGKSFYYADETEAVHPGETVSLFARLAGDMVYVKRDDRPIAYTGGGQTINGIALDGIDSRRVHIRRVIGQAVNGSYDGRRLGTLGPVVMTDASVCDPSGKVVDFTFSTASWHESRGAAEIGSSMWPSNAVSRLTRQGSDEVWLFR